MFKKSNLKYVGIFLVLILLFISVVSASVISYVDDVDYSNYPINNTYNPNGSIPINIMGMNNDIFVHIGDKFSLTGNVIKYNHSYLEELDVPVPMIYPPVHVFQAKKTGNTTVIIKTINIYGFTTITKFHIHILPKSSI
ncbi:MAG: hypothetical protein FWE58_03245 [Methanobrevibacter sp.]|nr:hypothetical protein [Methanobrevibacter sp.]